MNKTFNTKNILACIFLMAIMYYCTIPNTMHLSRTITMSADQLEYALSVTQTNKNGENVFPRTLEKGEVRMVSPADWTSGFFPGILWLMHELTNDIAWKNKAEEYTKLLESQQYNTTTHDVGFMMYCSYGRGYNLYKNPQYKKILLQTARSLTKRYNPKVKCIRSWDHSTHKYKYPVIIDNMMNLELLMWAYKESGEAQFKEIALNHARTTIKNHYRKDFSCYHVVDYDVETGNVIAKITNQGYQDESAWARGQAWGLYGYTIMYRETGLKEFLVQAEKIAEYMISHPSIPQDKIPYWDYDVPDKSQAPRDASAAAITASALYDLAQLSANKNKYLAFADEILTSLSSNDYMAKVYTNKGFLLKHSTGNMPINSEINVPIVYADYYFLEALLRKKNLKESK